ncbi:substrate-binding domain-containing protein, partial [Serratia marcescens]|nr:substrate-binding domain-containing protein [Serratia marcescens]
FDTASGHQVGIPLLSGPRPPTAVFAVNDFLAIGLMGAARDCGLTPGRDIAIVGFNDTPLAAQLPIALSSVHSPMRDMGYRAMELLLKKMKGETPASLKLEPQLVIRESSRGTPAR